MRIVIIADSIDTQNAGIHVYTRNMIKFLEKLSGHEIFCIRLKNGSDIRFKNDVFVPGIIPFIKKDPFRIFFSIPHAIQKLIPDIVIEPAHFGPFNLPRKIKRITIIHDLTPIMFPHWHNKYSRILQKIFLPSILKRASLVITNSNNTTKDLIEEYPDTKGKSFRIYPGVDPFFRLSESDFCEQKEPFFLTIGTIEPRKNLITLLKAYQQFRENSNLNYKLVICGGKGWKSDIFYRELEEHPYRKDIDFKGYVDKKVLKRLYSSTTAFIYPSLYEGFGFPVLEALSCGAPCIISNTSSLPEVGGQTAIYFDPQKPEDLASRLIELTSSNKLVNDLSLKGLRQSARFSWENFARELEMFLLELK
jgi:glycosyltransferase involved in cell wall biosynthesis